MTWEEAARKFKSHESSMHGGFSPMTGPRLSPAPPNSRSNYTHDPHEMDLDASPTQHTHTRQPSFSDARIRTPLPTGPRPEKPTNIPPLPGYDSFRADLQGSADRILASASRSRYAHVSVLLIQWQDDEDLGARNAIQDLAKVLGDDYNYTVQTKLIPTSLDESKSHWMWLSRVASDFIADQDQRDILKIFYYSGYSYLDGDRDTVFARFVDPASVDPRVPKLTRRQLVPSTLILPRPSDGVASSSILKTPALMRCSLWTARTTHRTRRSGGKACWN